MNARITGLGKYLPERVVTNKDLEAVLDTSDEWIRQRTGIEERRYAETGIGSGKLGALAAKAAIANAGLQPDDIDLILACTLSEDYVFPGNGVVIQKELGISNNCPAMDIRNQCSGFIYALSTANAFIKTGQYKRVLVVGSELHSAGLDMTPRGRDVSVIFGDGAAACVVEPCEEGRGILNAHIYSEGKYFDKLFIPESGCINTPRVTHEMVDKGTIWPKMEGKYVFKHAVTRMPEAIQKALDTCGRKVSDIDLLVCHQANLRINEMVAAGMEIPQEKVFNNIQKYGNTTAATIPLCLTEAREQGRLKDGDFVVLVAFGAGFTWGSAALVW